MPAPHFPLTVYYDASCRFCNAEMRNLMLRNTQGRLRFVDCAAPGFAGGPAPREALMRAIHGVDAQGQVFVGVECLSRAYQGVGLPWVHHLAQLPLLRPALHRLYPIVARNRYRLPQWPIAWIFEVAARRAAQQAARRAERCAPGRCDVNDSHT